MLVLRYERGGKSYTRVWRGWSYYHVLAAAYAKAKRVYEGKPKRLKPWGKRQDEMILAHYHTHTKTQIATMLSTKFKRKYNKNMVISRYHNLKLRENR